LLDGGRLHPAFVLHDVGQPQEADGVPVAGDALHGDVVVLRRGEVAAAEDDNITVQGVSGDRYAIGFLGLAYVMENEGRVKPAAIQQQSGECVQPSVDTAADGSYQPLTRPIFWYVSKQSADEKEHVRAFVEFAFDPDNQEALVSEVGYVPLPRQAAEGALAKFAAGVTGSAFDGGSELGVTIDDLVSVAGQ
ncbi:MAG TPA: hypothetical protein VHG92_12145, partial [Afifellaceae bacterium]|nr:hypothetical protein [Afifellaceae bacterium]